MFRNRQEAELSLLSVHCGNENGFSARGLMTVSARLLIEDFSPVGQDCGGIDSSAFAGRPGNRQ